MDALLKHKADPHLRNHAGLLPYDILRPKLEEAFHADEIPSELPDFAHEDRAIRHGKLLDLMRRQANLHQLQDEIQSKDELIAHERLYCEYLYHSYSAMYASVVDGEVQPLPVVEKLAQRDFSYAFDQTKQYLERSFTGEELTKTESDRYEFYHEIYRRLSDHKRLANIRQELETEVIKFSQSHPVTDVRASFFARPDPHDTGAGAAAVAEPASEPADDRLQGRQQEILEMLDLLGRNARYALLEQTLDGSWLIQDTQEERAAAQLQVDETHIQFFHDGAYHELPNAERFLALFQAHPAEGSAVRP